ncbi:receptor-activated Ca2+-permeable cation channel [Grosmannia clavigera kw1407]|uniref:Receptor-activated Ca2+-permeable cation channel n=1 Tax=Grosmannia clavigera (strain kw1407 / UAMH 11150) TaxID=655863 RepID=F0XSB2_GROCL|nr:receptor-activated Ca2+-permeable cation channel [Grosmannia clavigera kw1407]EFW99534.1 receptor-activated Ca2+-permeable cation channel [Grosmannia clavigera kw1407]
MPTTSSSSSTSAERQPLLMRRTFSHEIEAEPVYACIANPHSHLPVYTNIHRIRRDIVAVVEDYLSAEQLRDMRINISVIRPLVDKLYELDDISIVYCLLVNRAQFLYEQSGNKNRQNVNFTRAALCELIAHRILRRFSEDNDGVAGLLVLSHILVAGFEPFQNAPDSVRQEASQSESWLYSRTLPALEVAILSESKLFLSSTACQKVIDAIYVGRVTYTPSSFIDIIPDHYKQKPIALYDPREASLLNQYRLIVPRTRNILETLQFSVLLGLYLCFMAERDASRYSKLEIAFAIFSFGWVLDQFATILEHGWHVYTQNLWSFLDVIYAAVYWSYLVLRLHGWRIGSLEYGQQALDALAMAAPVLIPRIAFTAMSDNLLFVSLRSMVADFTLLTALAMWCFAGFLLSLAWLGEGQHPIVTITKWMVYIWFGLDGTGIQRSTEFHWLLGPILMIAFAFLGNTLFLTILVSMLSNTFSTIVSNATAEIQYRRAVLTLEGVKSDAIFAYQPPFNILALFILVPLKFLVSPRWFHKIHVACVRTINLPVLLFIAIAERRLLWPASYGEASRTATPSRRSFWDAWRITVHGDIRAVFDLPPPDSVEDEIAADDDLTHHLIRRQFVRPPQVVADVRGLNHESRRTSAAPSSDIVSGKDGPDGSTGDESGTGRLSVVRFAESADLPPSEPRKRSPPPTALAPPPTLRHKHGVSRRDSIALPGLDPDKLRTLLDESDADVGRDTNMDGDMHSDGTSINFGSSRDRRLTGMHRRLGELEESMARIESMLGQLIKQTSSPDEDQDVERAHEVEEEVIDDGEMSDAEQTGSIADLDLTTTT